MRKNHFCGIKDEMYSLCRENTKSWAIFDACKYTTNQMLYMFVDSSHIHDLVLIPNSIICYEKIEI